MTRPIDCYTTVLSLSEQFEKEVEKSKKEKSEKEKSKEAEKGEPAAVFLKALKTKDKSGEIKYEFSVKGKTIGQRIARAFGLKRYNLLRSQKAWKDLFAGAEKYIETAQDAPKREDLQKIESFIRECQKIFLTEGESLPQKSVSKKSRALINLAGLQQIITKKLSPQKVPEQVSTAVEAPKPAKPLPPKPVVERHKVKQLPVSQKKENEQREMLKEALEKVAKTQKLLFVDEFSEVDTRAKEKITAWQSELDARMAEAKKIKITKKGDQAEPIKAAKICQKRIKEILQEYAGFLGQVSSRIQEKIDKAKITLREKLEQQVQKEDAEALAQLLQDKLDELNKDVDSDKWFSSVKNGTWKSLIQQVVDFSESPDRIQAILKRTSGVWDGVRQKAVGMGILRNDWNAGKSSVEQDLDAVAGLAACVSCMLERPKYEEGKDLQGYCRRVAVWKASVYTLAIERAENLVKQLTRINPEGGWKSPSEALDAEGLQHEIARLSEAFNRQLEQKVSSLTKEQDSLIELAPFFDVALVKKDIEAHDLSTIESFNTHVQKQEEALRSGVERATVEYEMKVQRVREALGKDPFPQISAVDIVGRARALRSAFLSLQKFVGGDSSPPPASYKDVDVSEALQKIKKETLERATTIHEREQYLCGIMNTLDRGERTAEKIPGGLSTSWCAAGDARIQAMENNLHSLFNERVKGVREKHAMISRTVKTVPSCPSFQLTVSKEEECVKQVVEFERGLAPYEKEFLVVEKNAIEFFKEDYASLEKILDIPVVMQKEVVLQNADLIGGERKKEAEDFLKRVEGAYAHLRSQGELLKASAKKDPFRCKEIIGQATERKREFEKLYASYTAFAQRLTEEARQMIEKSIQAARSNLRERFREFEGKYAAAEVLAVIETILSDVEEKLAVDMPSVVKGNVWKKSIDAVNSFSKEGISWILDRANFDGYLVARGGLWKRIRYKAGYVFPDWNIGKEELAEIAKNVSVLANYLPNAPKQQPQFSGQSIDKETVKQYFVRVTAWRACVHLQAHVYKNVLMMQLRKLSELGSGEMPPDDFPPINFSNNKWKEKLDTLSKEVLIRTAASEAKLRTICAGLAQLHKRALIKEPPPVFGRNPSLQDLEKAIVKCRALLELKEWEAHPLEDMQRELDERLT